MGWRWYVVEWLDKLGQRVGIRRIQEWSVDLNMRWGLDYWGPMGPNAGA